MGLIIKELLIKNIKKFLNCVTFITLDGVLYYYILIFGEY